ncbi:MAG: hypothetical protein AAGF47_10585 [Planctomycetota bacterium]
MRTLTLICCCALLAGCTVSRGSIDQGEIDGGSRGVISAVNRGIVMVDASSLTTEEKQAARELLGQLAEANSLIDQFAARAAGLRMSELEAAEVQATVAMIHRQLEGVASRPPASLARGGATLPPESQESLDELRRMIRR